MLLHQDHTHSAGKLGQAVGDLLDDADPDAFGGLVEHQQLGPAQQRAADRQHLALAAGQCAGRLPKALRQLGKEIEHLVDARDRFVLAMQPSSRFSRTVSLAKIACSCGT